MEKTNFIFGNRAIIASIQAGKAVAKIFLQRDQ
jgi:hypothetical protein